MARVQARAGGVSGVTLVAAAGRCRCGYAPGQTFGFGGRQRLHVIHRVVMVLIVVGGQLQLIRGPAGDHAQLLVTENVLLLFLLHVQELLLQFLRVILVDGIGDELLLLNDGLHAFSPRLRIVVRLAGRGRRRRLQLARVVLVLQSPSGVHEEVSDGAWLQVELSGDGDLHLLGGSLGFLHDGMRKRAMGKKEAN